MRLGLPAVHVEADFADEGLGYADIDAVDAGQVDAGDARELLAEIKLRRVGTRFPVRPTGRVGGRGASASVAGLCRRPRADAIGAPGRIR